MSDSFLRRIASGVLWSYAALLGGRVIVFAGLALAARVLTPAEFGEFAMAMTVVSFLEVVRGFGLHRALVYFDGRSESSNVLRTGFTLTMLTGIVLGGGLFLAAGPISDYFGVATVRDYVQALSLYFVIGALGIVPDAVMRNRLDFKQRFLPETAAPVARYALAIAFALAGFGAWSLVIGQVGGMIISVAFTFLGARWMPRFGFDPETAGQLLGFGWQMSTVDLCAAIVLNADYLFVGRFLGAEDLGLYSLAFRLPDTTIVAVAFAVAQLLLPAYVKLGADPLTLRTGFVETTRYLGMVLLPAACGIVVLAPVLVEALFGPKWADAAPLVQLLAVSALIRAMVFSPGAVFVASGRPSLAMISEIAGLIVSVPLFYLAAQRDVATVAAIQLLTAAAYGLVKLSLLRSMIQVSWTSMMRPLGSAMLASLAMTIVLLGIVQFRFTLGASWIAILGVAAGAATYAAILWSMDRSAILRVSEVIRGGSSQTVGAAS